MSDILDIELAKFLCKVTGANHKFTLKYLEKFIDVNQLTKHSRINDIKLAISNKNKALSFIQGSNIIVDRKKIDECFNKYLMTQPVEKSLKISRSIDFLKKIDKKQIIYNKYMFPSTRWYNTICVITKDIRNIIKIDENINNIYEIDLKNADLNSINYLFNFNIKNYKYYAELYDIERNIAKISILKILNGASLNSILENADKQNVQKLTELYNNLSYYKDKIQTMANDIIKLIIDNYDTQNEFHIKLNKNVTLLINNIKKYDDNVIVFGMYINETYIILSRYNVLKIHNKLYQKKNNANVLIKTTTISSQLFAGFTQHNMERIIPQLYKHIKINNCIYLYDGLIFSTNDKYIKQNVEINIIEYLKLKLSVKQYGNIEI